MIWAYYIGIILLCSGVYFFRKKNALYLISLIFIFLQICLNIFSIKKYFDGDQIYFKADALGLIFITVLSILTIPTIIQSFAYFNSRAEKPRNKCIYLISLFVFIGSMTGVFMANHIGILWIFAEATTLSIALLIYHERTTEAVEATWKYIFVSSIALSFSFIGILLLDISIIDFTWANFTFSELQTVFINTNNKLLLQIAFLLIVIGFSVKMGVFPLHTVCIDAHAVAPSPISALVSTSLMNVGFVSIFRFYTMLSHSLIFNWMNHVMLIIGILSIVFSAVYMLKVKNFKRLIAYSSIENMGIVALGMASGGIAWFGAIFHLIIHSFVKSGLFFQTGQVIRVYNTKKVYFMSNYFKINAIGGVVMIIALLLLTAIPPSGLFFSEFMVFSSMIKDNYIAVVVMIMLLLCFILFVLSKYFMKILFSSQAHDVSEKCQVISKWESVPQLVLFALAIYIGINPPPFLIEIIHQALTTLPK